MLCPLKLKMTILSRVVSLLSFPLFQIKISSAAWTEYHVHTPQLFPTVSAETELESVQ